MLEVMLDTFLDILRVFPFIFLIFILMEVIENAKNKEKIEKSLSNKGAPFIAGITGVIPECGFPVMCAKLYNSGLIKTGTLIAAFIAASDEGLIVLISNATNIGTILKFIVLKIVYAILAGLILNFLLKNLDNKHVCPEQGICAHCGEEHSRFIDKYILHPLLHALKTFAFVVIFAEIIAILFNLIGEQAVTEFLGKSKIAQPLFCAIIGIIPNCASSILLAQGYVDSVITFSGLVAGLCSNAGVGLIVLFRRKQNAKKAIMITGLLVIIGVAFGYLTLLFESFGF